MKICTSIGKNVCIQFMKNYPGIPVSIQNIWPPTQNAIEPLFAVEAIDNNVYWPLYHGRKIMTNQRTGNASIIFHNHPLCLPTVLYVGSVLVNEHRLVRVGHFKHHRPCYKLVKELTAQRLWE